MNKTAEKSPFPVLVDWYTPAQIDVERLKFIK